MRDASIRKQLTQRSSEIMERFLDESDPKTWPTADRFDHLQRKDEIKKQASESLAMVAAIEGLLRGQPVVFHEDPPDPFGPDEEDQDIERLADDEIIRITRQMYMKARAFRGGSDEDGSGNS